MELENNLRQISQKIVNLTILCGIFFAAIDIVSYYFSTSVFGLKWTLITYLIIVIFFTGLYLFRNNLVLKTRAHLLLILFLFLSVFEAIIFRAYGSFHIILLAGLLGIIVFGQRTGLFYIVAFIISFSAIVLLQNSDIVDKRTDLVDSEIDLSLRSIGCAVGVLLLVYISGRYLKLFNKSVKTVGEENTELKKALPDLRLNGELGKAFIENYPFPISIKDKSLRHIYANEHFLYLSQNESYDIDDINFNRLFPQSTIKKIDEADKYVLEKKAYLNLDIERVLEGEIRYFKILKFPLITHTDDILIGTLAVDVTDQKLAEKSLEISENKFKALFDLAGDAEILMQDGIIIDCNEKAIQLFSVQSKKDLAGKYIWELSPSQQPDGQESNKKFQNITQTILDKKIHLFEWKHRRMNGEQFEAEINVSLVDQEKEIFHAVYRDVTRRNETERALKESEERSNLIFNNLPLVIYKSTAVGKLIFISENVEKVLGFTAKENMEDINKCWFDRLHPDDLPKVRESFDKLYKEKVPFNHEYRYKTKSGNWIWLHDFANVVGERAGQPLILGTFLDITRRKQAEISHGESEERYKLLSEATFEAVVIHKEGKFVDFNKEVETIFGYNREEIKNKNLKDFIHPDDFEMVLHQMKQQIMSKYVIRGIKSDGTILYLEIHSRYIKINNEDHRLAVIRDVTEYKKIEFSLRSSEEKLRNIFNSVADAIFIVSLQNKILEANNLAIEEFGLDRQKISKLYFTDLFDVDSIDDLQEGNETSSFEMQITNAAGKKIPVELTLKRINFNGEEAYIASFHDIYERKHFQQKLFETMIESEERERERYAKEIHDGLGPILSTCKIYFHSINSITDADKRKEYVIRTSELLEDALRSVREISNNLSPHILRDYGLIQAIHSFAKKLETISGIHFNIQSNLEERLVDIIELTLYRALLELVNNTVKYSAATTVKIIVNKSEENLSVEYIDNGDGFDYNAVKEQGKGFGLSNVENRIKKIGGKYVFISFPGEGVHVKIAINLENK